MSKTVTFGAKPKNAPTPSSADEWVKHREPAADAAPEHTSEPMKRLTIDVTAGLHSKMKSQCALRGVKMADEVRALLMQHFGDGGAMAPPADDQEGA